MKRYTSLYIRKKRRKLFITAGSFSVICALTFVLAYGASLQTEAKETLNADIMEEIASAETGEPESGGVSGETDGGRIREERAAAQTPEAETASDVHEAEASAPDAEAQQPEQDSVSAGGVSAGSGEIDGTYLGEFEVTAYCPCEKCCGKSPDDPNYGITSIGAVATQGTTIAVDPDVIPYGTNVYLVFPEPYSYMNGIYVAEDTGVSGNRIDVFFNEHEEALQFGVRDAEVYIVD